MFLSEGSKFEACASSREDEKMRWDETRLITSINTWFISPVLEVLWDDEGKRISVSMKRQRHWRQERTREREKEKSFNWNFHLIEIRFQSQFNNHKKWKSHLNAWLFPSDSPVFKNGNWRGELFSFLLLYLDVFWREIYRNLRNETSDLMVCLHSELTSR